MLPVLSMAMQDPGRHIDLNAAPDRLAHDHVFCFTENCAGRLFRAAEDREAGYCGGAIFLDGNFDNLFTEVALLVTRGK